MKKIICYFICLLLITFVSACDEEVNYDGQVKVTFHLEGGTYMNCTRPVVLYFDYSDDDANYICSPDVLTRKEITRSGYNLAGWYKTKVENGENISYEDEFNFETDTVGKEELTLYAYWEKDTIFAYNVCYLKGNEKVVLGTYKVKAGAKFEDYMNYAKKNKGNTPLGYFDAEGNEWDKEFKHPGGNESLTIDVYVQYLEGDWTIVKTADDLKGRIAGNKNIYLANDIDMGGKDLCFDNYRGKLNGNGFTISNFNLLFGAGKNDLVEDLDGEGLKSIVLSLFGKTKNATIENINFTKVTFKLDASFKNIQKIYVAPLAITMENTILKNVNFNGIFELVKIHDDFSLENLIIVSSEAYYKKDDLSSIENVNVVLTKIEN